MVPITDLEHFGTAMKKCGFLRDLPNTLATVKIAAIHYLPQALSARKFEALLIDKSAHAPITVVIFDDKTYLFDGHHRLWLARIRGDKELLANCYDLN